MCLLAAFSAALPGALHPGHLVSSHPLWTGNKNLPRCCYCRLLRFTGAA